jgi:hypothetical protein
MTSGVGNQEISLGPPKFFKAPNSMAKPAEPTQPRRDIIPSRTQQHENDYRRGGMNISRLVKPKRAYKESKIELLSKDIVEEYVNNGDINEALKDFEDFNPIDSEQYEDLVRSIVQYILEKSEGTLTAVGKLFHCAIKEKKMQLQHFIGG